MTASTETRHRSAGGRPFAATVALLLTFLWATPGLDPVEASVLNNTMPAQVAVLAWVLLAEPLDVRQIAGLALATAGMVLVQIRPGELPAPDSTSVRRSAT